MLNELLKYTILLGSKSPRRREIIEELGLKYIIVKIELEEDFPDTLKPEWVSSFLAKEKSQAYLDAIIEDQILLTSDTTVIFEGQILGKPKNKQEAIDTLKILSGQKHIVNTGVCLRNSQKEYTFYESSEVYMQSLDEEEIHFYIDKYQPFDKAGSYGIQDWIGLSHISRINGSYSNIVGLPSQRLYSELKRF